MSGTDIVDALSFDLEDWFHMVGIAGLDDPDAWPTLPTIFERYTELILDELDRSGVHATFFIVGWMAARYPATIREVAARGHELGSHSHLHQTVYDLGPKRFAEDLRRSIDEVEQAGGQRVRGFRAPSFSLVPGCEWAFDALLDAGIEYDASLFPATRAHGGYPCPPQPHRRTAPSGRAINELPMSTMTILGRRLAFSGGGYLRLLPLSVVRAGIAQTHAERRPVVVYLHPRDFAVGGPTVPMPLHRRFKATVGLGSTRRKLRALIQLYRFDTCHSVLNGWLAENGDTADLRHF